MKGSLTVTEKKLAANRQNAKRSTGPRTERGKNKPRFNAVTTGLFSEHVVIPSCDSEDSRDDVPRKQFANLLAALQQEYNAETISELFWVDQIADCMWKQRRMSRSENALVRAAIDMKKAGAIGRAAKEGAHNISVLEGMLKWFETMRANSPETCESFIPLIPWKTGFPISWTRKESLATTRHALFRRKQT